MGCTDVCPECQVALLTAGCTRQLSPTAARTHREERTKKGEDYKRREEKEMEMKWKGKQNVERRTEVD